MSDGESDVCRWPGVVSPVCPRRPRLSLVVVRVEKLVTPRFRSKVAAVVGPPGLLPPGAFCVAPKKLILRELTFSNPVLQSEVRFGFSVATLDLKNAPTMSFK